MDALIGRKGVFLPRLIIIDDKGNHIETTNRTKLPGLEKMKKANLLGYELNNGTMPLTNPAVIADELEKLFGDSVFVRGSKG